MENESQVSSEYAEPLKFSDSEVSTGLTKIASGRHFRIFKVCRNGRWQVLKGLQPDFAADAFWMGVLEKEYDIAKDLDHPNIVRVRGCENNPDVGPCIVMDYVEGRTLAEFLKENPSTEKRRKVVEQLLSAMRYYHALQVVHRDLKPENILITRNGDDVKLIDFGCADTDYHATAKGPAYTEGYAAPEQLAGEPVDCRTDIYAFGVLLREIFPKRYRRVARRCTQTNPVKRYNKAQEVEKGIINTDIDNNDLRIALPTSIIMAEMHHTGNVIVKDNNELWGIVDDKGNTAVPCRWTEISTKNRLRRCLSVKDKNCKWGVYNFERGEMTIPCQWKHLADVWEEGWHDDIVLFAVSDDGAQWCLLDEDGTQLTDCWYDKIQGVSIDLLDDPNFLWADAYTSCQEERIIVCYQGRWGLLDADGKTVLSCIWRDLQLLDLKRYDEKTPVWFQVKNDDGLWGIVDYDGNTIESCQWNKIYCSWQDGRCGIYTKNGNNPTLLFNL